jgi:hypothetical protein
MPLILFLLRLVRLKKTILWKNQFYYFW